MPVLIVGAGSDVGRALAEKLREQDAQVRVYLQADDPAFRTSGCKVAVGELDDIGRIESAMEQVHTVVHLAGGPVPPIGRSLEWLVEETTEVAVRAAVSAGVVRFLCTSEIGADVASGNAYLRARARADALVAKSGIQFAVLRCAPVLGRLSLLAGSLREARRGRTAVAPGSGNQRLNPVFAGDVAGALLAADSREDAVAGLWEIGGPEVLTYDDLASRASGTRRIAHRRRVPGLPRDLALAWATDCVADSAAFRRQFGWAPATSVTEALALSLSPRDD